MSICPDHGGYTGDACKKCQVNVGGGPMAGEPREIEKLGSVTKLSGPPKLDEHDKLTLVKLENDSLKSFHRMQTAQAQFQSFAQAMFEKYKVKPAEYTLDMEKLEFVVRGM